MLFVLLIFWGSEHKKSNLFGKAVGCPECHECIVSGELAACMPNEMRRAHKASGPQQMEWKVDKFGNVDWVPIERYPIQCNIQILHT